ncbi:MAG: glycosyltransferase family 39 protein [Candidatus Omnitrophica bacterium]|nr:glycosyltransferase family 39 protein [Candidatus Omnitrophota bacterium]
MDNHRSDRWRKILTGILLGGILLLAACLRLQDLGKNSLWGDEINMMQVSSEPNLAEVWKAVRRPHSVGYPAFLHFWQRIDRAESMIRLPSAAAGVLGVGLLYWIGTLIGNRGLGLSAAFLLAIAPGAIRFSREVAPYGLQNAVILGIFLVWLYALLRDRWLYWLLLAFLAAWSHYLHPLASPTPIGLLLMTPIVWWVGLPNKDKGIALPRMNFSLVKWASAFALYGLLILPQAYDNFRGSRQYVESAKEVLGFSDYFQEIFRLFGKFNPECSWAAWAILPWVIIGIPILFYRSWVLGLAILGWASGTFAIWFAFWWVQSHFFDYHYLTSHLPALLLFASAGIVWVASLPANLFPKGSTGRTLIGGIVGVGILGGILYASIPVLKYEANRVWPNYREAGEFLTYRLRPQDRYYVQPDHFLSLKLKYYAEEVLDQEVGFDIFFDKEKQKQLADEDGILYIASGKPLGAKKDYQRKYLHGVNLQWNPEAQDQPGFYKKVYQQLLPLDLYKYGLILEAEGDLPSALAALVQAASESPEDYRAVKKKAEVLYKLGLNKESIEGFKEALPLAPEGERWWLWVEIGKRYSDLGDLENEIASYRKGLEEPEPKAGYLWEIIGEAYYQAGRFEDAVEPFRNALEADPNRSRSLIRLGEILAEKDPSASKGFIEKGRALLGRDDYYWIQKADEVEKNLEGGSR